MILFRIKERRKEGTKGEGRNERGKEDIAQDKRKREDGKGREEKKE